MIMAANYEIKKLIKKGWTKIPNSIRHDKNLTSDAKVVLEELLSVSGDYHISEAGISSSIHISLERVKKAVKLLKDTGYLDVLKQTNNSRFTGYVWKISDTPGALRKGDFRKTENPTLENPTLENPSDGISDGRNSQRSKTRQTENPSTYKYTERYQGQNNEEMNYQGQKGGQLLHHQPDVEDEAETLPKNSGNSSWESSSEAKASPLPNKTPIPSTQKSGVMSQQEFEFQQFLKKYPKKPTGTDMAATKQAFFEATAIDGSYAEIMAGLDAWCGSVDWTKEGGRYITKPLYFLTTRKWEELPRSVNSKADQELLDFVFGGKYAAN
jgi:hypothetical protein